MTTQNRQKLNTKKIKIIKLTKSPEPDIFTALKLSSLSASSVYDFLTAALS